MIRPLLACLLLVLLSACPPAERKPAGTAETTVLDSPTLDQSWNCRNDLEIHCADGACKAAAQGEFTPMGVHLDASGEISVCAYSGCWEGTSKVVISEEFVIVTGHDLPFSTSDDPESAADVALTLDRSDRVAILKVGPFAQPQLCQEATASY